MRPLLEGVGEGVERDPDSTGLCADPPPGREYEPTAMPHRHLPGGCISCFPLFAHLEKTICRASSEPGGRGEGRMDRIDASGFINPQIRDRNPAYRTLH